MEFKEDNNVVQRCAKGMEFEARGLLEEAGACFSEAWDVAKTDFEKFTAAHYVARHQKTIEGKLQWDKMSLALALKINDETVNGALPSLYLNVAKCYEDLQDYGNATLNYELAMSFLDTLPADGYGAMIRGGVLNGIQRVKSANPDR